MKVVVTRDLRLVWRGWMSIEVSESDKLEFIS